MASPSLSAGDYQRLCRLKQLSSTIGRRRGLEKGAGGAESARKKESAQGGAVAVPPEPSEAEPAAEPQPAASADSVAAARPAPSALQRARVLLWRRQREAPPWGGGGDGVESSDGVDAAICHFLDL